MYDVTPITDGRETDCGAVALKMLLEYYGQTIALDTLIADCNITVAGCSGLDIINAGKKYGLDMLAFSMDADELIQQDRPAIVWWLYHHWIVFCGQDDNGFIVICNPSKGRYRMPKGLFKSYYSGVSIWNGEPEPVEEQRE